MKDREHSVSGAGLGSAPGGAAAGGRPTPKQREQQRRRQRALELRTEGKTLTEIADELGWSGPSGVSYALKRARKEPREAAPVEDLEELRNIQYARLEEMFSRAYPLALGGRRNGELVPPDPKYLKIARQILADETELLGLNVDPAEVFAEAALRPTQPSVAGGAEPVIVVDFDEQRYREAMRRSTAPTPDLSIGDDQPPAGRIAARPGDSHTEPENTELAPNSTDPVTGQPVFDPRVALKRD